MEIAPQTHGLDGSLVPCDWPPLTLEELRPILAEFPTVGKPLRLLSVSPRPFSAASTLETTSRRIFVKRHHRSIRTACSLAEEHRFLIHLLAHGFAVPRLYTTHEGSTALERNEWTYEVHSIPAGVDLYGETLSWLPFFSVGHARSAGRFLARLHLASASFQAPARRPRPLVSSFSIFASRDPQTALERYLVTHPALSSHAELRRCADEALALLAPFHAELQPLLASIQPLWTHNDFHPSNLFWSDQSAQAQPTAAIDFGLADRTFAVYDIVQAIERGLIGWLAIVEESAPLDSAEIHFDQIEAFLNGYESVRPLSVAEAAALAPSLALCHVEFALTEADYFLSVLHDDRQAPYAYRSYLLGHAKWFLGPGAALLDTLRRRRTR